MKIKTIGFGATKNIGNYSSLKVYFEAELESDEYIDTYMDALRALASVELDLGDDFSTLRVQIRNKKRELADLVAAIDAAKFELDLATNKWQNLLDYFAASHPAIGSIITGVSIPAQVNFDEIDDDDNDDNDTELPFEPIPFEVDSFSDIPCPDFPLLDEEGCDRNF